MHCAVLVLLTVGLSEGDGPGLVAAVAGGGTAGAEALHACASLRVAGLAGEDLLVDQGVSREAVRAHMLLLLLLLVFLLNLLLNLLLLLLLRHRHFSAADHENSINDELNR